MKFVFTLAILFISSASLADYACRGNIVHLGFSNMLNVHNGFGVHRLCNLSDDNCKAWMSLILAAKMANKEVTIYYRDPVISGNQANGACTQIGDWVTPVDKPYYVEIH